MDAGRFDAISRSIANRSSRRSALRGLGAGGILAALGVERAPAASGTCSLTIFAKTSAGPHKNTAYSGTLKMQIGDGGAIDSGTFETDNGGSFNLVGQATGRALNLRITLADGGVLALDGTAERDLILCRGAASGTFGGPSDTDIGTWRTGQVGGSSGGASGTSSGGSSGGGSGTTSGGGGGGSTTGGSSGGGGTTTANGGGGGTANGGGTSQGGGGGDAACASGVVCGGVCCQSISGLTPDGGIACNPNDNVCECTYSCGAAGCPEGGDQGSILVTCGSDPEPQCHNSCNFPTDNGCGDVTCDNGTQLDLDTCTCLPAGGGAAGDCGGADLLHDSSNCGFCGVVCGSGFCQNGVCTDTDPCPATGRTNCSSQCVDTQNDANNCGGCGVVCPSGQCIEGGCTDVVN